MKSHAAFACALALASCSSGTAALAPTPSSDTSTRPTPALTEEDRVAPADCAAAWVAAATGRVVDNTGAPIEGASVGYCVFGNGLGNCLKDVKTTKNGWYNYPIETPYRCIEKLAVRIYAPEATKLRVSENYCKPALTPVRGVLDVATDDILYRLAAPTSLPAIGDPKASRTVTFSDIDVTLIPDSIVEGDQYARMSAGVLDLKSPPCFVPKDLMLEGLVAFSPNMNVNVFGETINKIGFKLKTTLPEGTAVDLYILGGLATQLNADKTVDEGEFVKFGTGKVQSGKVVPDAGSELPALTVLGYRRR